MKINVNDLDAFNNMLKAVIKIVPDAKFDINSEGVNVKVINDSQTIRGFFNSDCVTADEDVELCFKDIVNLRKSLELIDKIEHENECELDFNGTFISYSNDVKFKLKVVKPDIIEQYITQDIKAKLEPVFKFNSDTETIRQALGCTNIISDSDSKVYISESDDGKVVAEIDNKKNKMANSVGIPIADCLDDGSIDSPIAVNIDNFQAFITLPSDDIEVVYTDKSVFEIRSEYEGISLYMISTTLKD